MSSFKSALAERLDDRDASEVRAEIRRLVEAGRVDEARYLLREELARGRSEDELGRWPELLALPKSITRPGSGRGDFIENMRWLEAHRDEHRGEWVALRDGAMVDHDRSRRALSERLAKAGLGRAVLCVKVDE